MNDKHILTIDLYKQDNGNLSFKIYQRSEDVITWTSDFLIALQDGLTVHEKNDACIVGMTKEDQNLLSKK